MASHNFYKLQYCKNSRNYKMTGPVRPTANLRRIECPRVVLQLSDALKWSSLPEGVLPRSVRPQDNPNFCLVLRRFSRTNSAMSRTAGASAFPALSLLLSTTCSATEAVLPVPCHLD